jgi:hypothetical protein
MNTQVLFNPLTYIDRLTRGGFSADQARASAEALETAFSESVATKTDVSDVKREVTDVKREITQAKTDLIANTSIVETRLKLEISQTKHELLRWLFGFNIVLVSAIFTIVKFVR